MTAPALPQTLRALLIPADPDRPLTVLALTDTAAAISQAIGGHLIDDTITGTTDGHPWALYLPDRRRDLPDNPRAAAVTARLGLHQRVWQAALHGDVLITGLAPDGLTDHDVPVPVLDAATRTLSTGPALRADAVPPVAAR